MPAQAQAYFADGTPIPAADLSKAVAEGKAHFDRDAEVFVRDAEGRRGTVSGTDVAQLLASGGTLETEGSLAEEEAGAARKAERERAIGMMTSPGQLYAGYLEALHRGASLGGTDLGLTALLGEEYRQGAQARAANPATAIPELAGAGGAMVAGELLAGPAGGAAGAGRAAGVLGRLSQVVTAPGRALAAAGRGGEALGVAGGEALGLGATGTKAFGLLGRGAAEGAIAGTGAEVSAASLEDRDLVVEKLMAAAGHGALMGGGLNVALGGGAALGRAGRAALQGMGEGAGLSESLRRYGERRAFKASTDNAVRYYNEATNFGRNPERIQRIGGKLLDTGVTREALSNQPKLLRAVESQLEQNGRALRAIADQLDATGVKVFPSRVLRAVDEQIAKARSVELGHFGRIADTLEREVAPIRAKAARGEAWSFGEMWNLRRNFDKTIKHAQKEVSPAAEEFKKLRGVFDDALDNATAARPELTQPWLKAKEDFSDFRIVRDALQDSLIRREKNRTVSPSDYFSGGMAFLSAVMSGGNALAALATAAGASLVNKQLREKGPGSIARIADRLSKFDKRTDAAIAAAVTGRPKDLPELPKRTIPLLAALADGAEEPVRTTSDQRERYEKTLRLVKDLAADPPAPEAGRRLGNATASLAEDFPELAQLLNERVIAAAKALHARAPMPLQRPNPLQQHLEARRVPAGLIAKWLREVDAADMPESIWHDLARGRVPREKIEFIKETQPYLFEDWRGRVMRMVAERSEKLSRPQRIRLSLAFDFTGDPSIDPARIAQIQGEYAAMRQAEQQAPQGPAPGAAQNLSTKQADDMKPPTESLLATG